MLNRREAAEAFRQRLAEVIRDSGLSRTAFAARIGTDRSTLSQLLSGNSRRLPRAETIAAIAGFAQVSVDWLLGLSQEGPLRADLVEESVAIEPGAGSPVDARLQRWHAEAVGYKIRYVPSTLPDLLKTEAVIRYEYSGYEAARAEGRIEQAEARLAYGRRPETDIEICSSWQALEAFARGEGLWRALSPDVRIDQIEVMVERLDELYPTVRWFLFDGLRRYCAPLTVFGPLRAVLYVGDMYLVFTSTRHVRTFTTLFDSLIRSAVMQPPQVIEHLHGLLRRLREGS
jgi:transcriptional regulator with XRE-family HTH domain